ncbi:MAG: ribosomal-protein-alanine N-acetyltransferase [Candidatus Endobugula sp.]|jgi:ribosomal-protein-alanine N-acetyltransferase
MMAELHNSRNDQPYLLRDMSENDLDVVIAIEHVDQLHPWSRASFLSSIHSSHQCYIVEDNKQHTSQSSVAAYAIVSTAADEAELLNITVSSHYQRQGIGSLLLQHLSESFDGSITTFFLEVRRSNLSAIALYDTHYFNEVGVRTNYYPSDNGCREDAIIMALSLSL